MLKCKKCLKQFEGSEPGSAAFFAPPNIKIDLCGKCHMKTTKFEEYLLKIILHGEERK